MCWCPTAQTSVTTIPCAPQIAAAEPPESAFKPASKQAPVDDGDRKASAGKDAAAARKQERAGSVWGVFGRVSSLLSSASNGKKKVHGSAWLRVRVQAGRAATQSPHHNEC